MKDEIEEEMDEVENENNKNKFIKGGKKKRKFDTLLKKADPTKPNNFDFALRNAEVYDHFKNQIIKPGLDVSSSGMLLNYILTDIAGGDLALDKSACGISSKDPNVYYKLKYLSNFKRDYIRFINAKTNYHSIVLIPDHYVYDIFNLYFLPSNQATLNKDGNNMKFNILKYINNSSVKILTNNHYVNSYFFLKNSLKFLLRMIEHLQRHLRQNLSEQLGGDKSKSGEFSNKTLQYLLSNANVAQDLVQDQNFRKALENLPENIIVNEGFEEYKKCTPEQKQSLNKIRKELINQLPTALQKSSDENGDGSDKEGGEQGNIKPGNKPISSNSSKHLDKVKDDLMEGALQQSADYSEFENSIKNAESEESFGSGNDMGAISEINSYQSIIDQLKRMDISKTNVTYIFENILNKIKSHFKFSDKYKNESLIDSDIIDSINEQELMLTEFDLFNLNVEDVTTKNRQKEGKLVVYVDISGSMDGEKLIIAKALIVKLWNLGIVEKVYFFDTRIYGTKKNPLKEVYLRNSGGGTSFTSVYNNIQAKRKESFKEKHALVITDGEDHLTHYDPNIFWVGIGREANFNCFKKNNQDSQQYIERKQCINFSVDRKTMRYKMTIIK
jgi:uncharacterized protein with von Willebrand factor type A (vWA) domain